MGIDNQHLDKPPRCLFPRQTARRSTSTCSVRAYLSQRRIITSQSTTTLIPRTSTSSRLASPLPPADTSRPNSHGNITTTSPLRVLTTSANGFPSPPRLSQLPTSSNNDREGGYRRRDAGGEGKEGAPSGEFAPQFRGGFGRGAGRGGAPPAS